MALEMRCAECDKWVTPEEIAYGHDCESDE